MARRIIKKKIAVNRHFSKRTVHIVDGTYYFLNKRKAENWAKKYTASGKKRKR
jgi:hypothetical protein